MARARDQFRQSDVTFWGIVALSCGAVALLSANVSALLPDSVFAGLHATRLGGISASEMHATLASLTEAQARLETTSGQLSSRLDTDERGAGRVQQRVSALEVSVPQLTEAFNTRQPAAIDPSIVTGSIGTAQPGFSTAKPANVDPAPLPMTTRITPAQAASVAPDRATGLAVSTSAAPPTADTASVGQQSSSTASTPSQPMPAAIAWAALPDTIPTRHQPGLGSVAAMANGTANPVPLAPSRMAAPAPMSAIHVAPRPDVIAEGAITPSPASPTSNNANPSAASQPPTKVASADAPAPTANVRAVGAAIGAPTDPAGALAAWQALAAKVGILLVGTSPLLADDPAGSNGKVLVAGPLPDIAAATKLCESIDRAGIACTPMPYVGSALAPATGSP